MVFLMNLVEIYLLLRTIGLLLLRVYNGGLKILLHKEKAVQGATGTYIFAGELYLPSTDLP